MRSQRPAPVSAREALDHLIQVLSSRATLRHLLHKLHKEHLLIRASALAYDTLLALVPFLAVSMGSVGVLGGRDTLSELLRELARYYVPRSAGPAIESRATNSSHSEPNVRNTRLFPGKSNGVSWPRIAARA